MAESPVTLREKVSFGLGAVGKDMAYAAMAVYLMMYFTDVVGVSAAFVGVIFLVARLWDAFNDPIMGWIVDNTKSRWGKSTQFTSLTFRWAKLWPIAPCSISCGA